MRVASGSGLAILLMVLEVLTVLVGVFASLAIGLYTTWLFQHLLRRGEKPRKAFGEWLSNVVQAIMGL